MALLWVLGAPAAAAEETARLRVAHLSPDTPAVDVALAPLPPDSSGPLTDPGPDLTGGLAYGEVGDLVDLAPGSYALSVRAAGTPRDTAPILSTRVELPAGSVRTAVVSGRFADLALHTLSEDHSAPPPGTARVRVLAAAGAVTALDVAVQGGPSLATALPFGAAGEPRVVPAGPASLTVGGAGAPSEVPLEFTAGSVVTLLVLDGAQGGLVVRPVVDAAGPAVVPTGSVEAGSGGGPGTPALVPLAGVALIGLASAGRRGRVLVLTTALLVLSGAATGAATAAPRGPDVAVDASAGRPAAPVRIAAPSTGLDAGLVDAGLDASGALVPPADPVLGGWYADGPLPGETGPAVVAGHVDWAGAPGVFAGLAELQRGAEIVVTRADGSAVRFAVTRVVRHPKDAFPTAEVYAPTAGAELRLITCGGAFDRVRGSYEDNVVVFAVATA